jgi:hypothetical protein
MPSFFRHFLRDCPKRDLSNAPGMTLAGRQRKTPKGGFSVLCGATLWASSRLFGQSQKVLG